MIGLPNEPPVTGGFRIGWEPLVKKLVADLDGAAPGWRVVQVKEKLGGLRFMVDVMHLPAGQRQAARALVEAAEATSLETCDVCGQAGALVRGFPARTRCAEHTDLRPYLYPDGLLEVGFEWPDA